MKTTKLVAVLGVATFATAILGTTVVQAAESDTTKGKVTFVENKEDENTGGVVDPEKPNVVDPVTPPPTTTNPETGKPEPTEPPGIVENNGAKLIAYTNFSFGKHYVTNEKATYDAVFYDTDKWSNDKVMPHFIQVQNEALVKTWKVTAKLGDFVEGGGGTLANASVKLNNLTLVTQNGIAAVKPGPDSIELNVGESKDIASYNNTGTPAKEDGVSINSINFGTLSDTTTAGQETLVEDASTATGYAPATGVQYNSGVQLVLGAGSGMKKDTTYASTLTWTLSATPEK